LACGGRNAVDLIERGHHATDAGVNSCLVRREKDVVHGSVAHVCRVVVAPRFCRAIQRKVFYASHHGVGRSQVGALVSAHHDRCDARTQIGVFSSPLCHAAPPRVTANVDHRGKHPIEPVRAGLYRCDACAAFYSLEIPACGQAQGDGENRSRSVDYVKAKEQRYFQSRFIDSHFLKLPDRHRGVCVEHPAYKTLPDLLLDIFTDNRTCDIKADRHEVQLTNLLLECHLAQKAIDERVHSLVGPTGFARTLSAGCRQHGDEYYCKWWLHYRSPVWYQMAGLVKPSFRNPSFTSGAPIKSFHKRPVR